MTGKRLSCLVLAALLFGTAPAGAAPQQLKISAGPAQPQIRNPAGAVQQARKDPARDILLQTIGMLAGQGLVLGHESLDGIFARVENKLLTREKAEGFLTDEARYADLVLATFKGRLMSQLGDQERKDLSLLIGFYEAQRESIAALSAYVRDGGGKNRESFEKNQERVAVIIHQISLGATAP